MLAGVSWRKTIRACFCFFRFDNGCFHQQKHSLNASVKASFFLKYGSSIWQPTSSFWSTSYCEFAVPIEVYHTSPFSGRHCWPWWVPFNFWITNATECFTFLGFYFYCSKIHRAIELCQHNMYCYAERLFLFCIFISLQDYGIDVMMNMEMLMIHHWICILIVSLAGVSGADLEESILMPIRSMKLKRICNYYFDWATVNTLRSKTLCLNNVAKSRGNTKIYLPFWKTVNRI